MTTQTGSGAWRHIGLVFVAALGITGLLWPLIYRSVPMVNLWIQGPCYLMLAALGYVALRAEGLSLRQVGLTAGHLLRALAVLATAYLLFVGLLLLLAALGARGPLTSDPLYWKSMALSWLFVGLSEELLFRGFLLVALARLVDRGGFPWRAILLSAALFSLYHLPIELWVGQRGGALVVQLLLPFVSSAVVLGPLYALSRNLWLVALVHGVIDYPVLCAIKEDPLMGLCFMAIVLVMGRYLLRPAAPLPLQPDLGNPARSYP